MQTRGHAEKEALDWIVLERGDVVCVHCGTHALIGESVALIAAIQLVLRQFIRDHARCAAPSTRSRPRAS